MRKQIVGFIVNNGLLFSGLVMSFSGLLIQLKYHMGNHGSIDSSKLAIGLDHAGWSTIHKFSISVLSLFMALHIILHWKWHITIINKNLIRKNRQVISLTIIFVFTAITGYIAWIIKFYGGEEITSKEFIEIHDKLALILFIYLILHLKNRIKWFHFTFVKLIRDKQY